MAARHASCLRSVDGATARRFTFNYDIVLEPLTRRRDSDLHLLDYLAALTFDFERDGRTISAVLIYAEPDPDLRDRFRPIAAQETGYEGIACLDDTARAAVLALGIYERTRSRTALVLARRWLSFVEYMQYPDGSFANFIRNSAGIRNATGPTSHRGGYWWSVRAQWALARAYRLTHEADYLERYNACRLAPIPDGKINALQTLTELELYQAAPSDELRKAILERCEVIIGDGEAPYFLDHPASEFVHLWGYHQLHAVAAAARALECAQLLRHCRRTVDNLVGPDVRACFWHTYPERSKSGICAYDVSPMVQGLAAMHRANGARRYRQLALQAASWFYGRNDARSAMYDPTTGRCRDGITDGVASRNFGAESAIEAGLAELERRDLLADS